MSKLERKIEGDLHQALKGKESEKVSVLRFLRAALNEKSIQKGKKELQDEEVIQIIKRQIRQNQDSIEAFKKGNRDDLVKKEEGGIHILKEYLPPESSKEEIQENVRKAIEEIKPEGKKDFGRIMGQVMGLLKGKADGKLVSQVVNEELSKLEEKND